MLGPGVPWCDATTAILGECVVHKQVDYLEYRQHTGPKQQTDEAAQLT